MKQPAVALPVVAALVLWASVSGAAPVVRLSTPFRVEVTGSPAPVRTLRLALEAAAHVAFPELEDAEITLVETRPALAPLAPGRTETVEVRLAVATPGGAPLVWAVPAALTNVSAAWQPAAELFVSDSPETVNAEGILDSGTLEAARAARVLYHHQNGRGDRDMWLLLELSNPTAAAARLWVAGAAGGPYGDELRAGHAAARGFLEQYWMRAGMVLDLPPNGIVPLIATRVPPGQVASGLAQIALLRGRRVDVQLAAQFPREGDPPVPSRVLPVDTQHQRGVFGAPRVIRRASYAAGGQVAQLWIGAGEDLLHDRTSGVPLHGNYGVVYTFEVAVSNPGSAPATAALIMHAVGGPAAATFLVNGTMRDAANVQPNAPRTIASVAVPAGGTAELTISTMSEGGSSYPVLLTVGPP